MSRIAEQVREFHEVYGCDISETPNPGTGELRRLRFDLIEEELGEFEDAAISYVEPNLVEMADALGDIAYVVYGAALAFGIDLDAVVDEIHRSNMSKLGADGKPIYSDGTDGKPVGKVLKGPDYFRPDIAAVLAKGASA